MAELLGYVVGAVVIYYLLSPFLGTSLFGLKSMYQTLENLEKGAKKRNK